MQLEIIDNFRFKTLWHDFCSMLKQNKFFIYYLLEHDYGKFKES